MYEGPDKITQHTQRVVVKRNNSTEVRYMQEDTEKSVTCTKLHNSSLNSMYMSQCL